MRLILSTVILIGLLILAHPAAGASGTWSRWSLPEQPIDQFAQAADSSLHAVGGAMLAQSMDGGRTWRVITPPVGAGSLSLVQVDPSAPHTLYVGSRERGKPGLFRSDNAGQTWTTVYTDSVTALAVSAIPAHRVSIGVGGSFPSNGMAVLQSDDQGATWRQVWSAPSTMGAGAVTGLAALDDAVVAGALFYHGGGLTLVSQQGGRWLIGLNSGPKSGFAAPAQLAWGATPATLVAQWSANGPFVLASLRKTTDGGRSWQDITPPLAGKQGEQVTPAAGGPRLTAVTMDRLNTRRIFTAATWCDSPAPQTCDTAVRTWIILASEDGGATWTQVGDPLAVGDIRALAYHSASQTLLAGTDRGVMQYAYGGPSASSLVAPWLRAFYDTSDGPRLLGRPLTPPTMVGPYPAQLFEKGRVEDHSAEERDPAWRLMYGLLVDELIAARSERLVGGDRSTVTYATLADAAREELRLAPPPDLARGVRALADGNVFVPVDPALNAAPGHTVPPVFWQYINRRDLFPGGWLHDVGLPITEPMTATVDKGDALGRAILVQAFQRTVLTYDPANPAGWQVERANVGSDYLAAFGDPQ